MPNWKQLALLSEEKLSTLEVAVVNLACTEGLPDAEQVNVTECVERLDRWAAYAQRYTESGLIDFHSHPSEYNNSEAYFRILCLITALQRDMGLQYNQEKIPVDVPLDTSDVFIHGALFGAGGTCASIPVIYTAVGRRLGYPLKLVLALGHKANHFFCRWDDHQDRFNIEATSKGLNCYPDDYYRQGTHLHSPEGEQDGRVLQSQTRKQELSTFLMARAFCWLDYGNYRQATNSFAWASAADPGNRMLFSTLTNCHNRWLRSLGELEPPHFPDMFFRWPPRRFPEPFPLDLEHSILWLEARENVLKDPELNRKWWDPLRQNVRLPVVPSAINVDMTETHCHLSLELRSNP